MSSKVTAQMAKVAPAVAPKSTPPDAMKGLDALAKGKAGKMHKRSRSGCFTCRLRRKKCNEDKPCCKACRLLGLKCEYKRPVWWGNNEQRKAQKEHIKDVIKRTKMNEKAAQHGSGADSPPGLTHSLPTSSVFPDAPAFQRAGSQDSYDSFDFNQPQHDSVDLYNPEVYTPQFESQFDPGAYHYANGQIPYEVDIKTERQMFVNDVQTRTDTSISTFSTFHPPNFNDSLADVSEGNWLQEELYEDPTELFGIAEEDEFGMFDFSHATAPPSHQASISVDELDRPLLEHLIDNVLPLTFPILDVNQPGLARSEVILPALESNKTYLHCCLSAAAVHMRFSGQTGSASLAQLDNDIMRHRFSTITELCEAFKRDNDHGQILDATLALIVFQSATGHPDDTNPDIAWYQHFDAVADLIRKLDLHNAIGAPAQPSDDPNASSHPPPFSMSLAAWIDILGATMLGRAPIFADSYRDAHLAQHRSLGLGQLMGCDDGLMVLLSEISCLEALRINKSLSEVDLCSHITMLGQQMDLTEPTAPGSLVYPYADSGALRPRQLGCNVTALFRKAARIWLQSLVPGARKSADTMKASLDQFAELVDLIPSGPGGFDRSIVWPVFTAGLQTSRGSALRNKIEERWVAMGDGNRDVGAWGRMVRVLREVWRRADGLEGDETADVDGPHVHWRDVMRECRLDFLPI